MPAHFTTRSIGTGFLTVKAFSWFLLFWERISLVLHCKRLILDKTEGVPYFIEEFVKSLQDLDVIEKVEGQALLLKDPQLVAIPSTIQDIIMAKVDQLSDAVKAVLQAGATIEREFSYALIKRILGIGETELLACLDLLKKSELLYERDIHPDNTYVFRHAMTRGGSL